MRIRVSDIVKVSALGLVVAAAGVLGCQSQSDKAKGQMLSQASKFREQLQGMPAQIDETTKRLVAATAGQNPKRADDFREFNKSLESLRKQAMAVGSEANAAEVDAAKYFTAWTKDATRAPSADRAAVRAEAAASKAQVDQALGYLQQARSDFGDLMAAYDNVSKLMSKDLSESAILAAQKDVQAAMSKSLDVRNRIDRLDDAIDAALASK
ncbi:MAG: hypothetical protein IT438_04615 [Phycisphaerales bacterium]|nr:hypothetical protein [Phycisphaerales bacterium]